MFSQTHPDVGSLIVMVFGAEGALASRIQHYRPRPGQLDMARAVHEAIRDGEAVMVDAPTGTGKSLAYGVVAGAHALAHGKRVLIVTSSNGLIQQLVKKDLPLVTEVLAELGVGDLQCAILKGTSNYACRRKIDKLEGAVDPVVERLVGWAAQTQTGDREELPFVPLGRHWDAVSATTGTCRGTSCKRAKDCFAMMAKQRAMRSQVVVTNYHMLLTHVSLAARAGRPSILKFFDVMVCDEADKLPDIARQQLGFRVTPRGLSRAVRRLDKTDELRVFTDPATVLRSD